MAKYQCEDGIQIAPRCLGIVFKERKQKKQDATVASSDDSQVVAATKLTAGEQLFREFIAENDSCFWNPHLQESIKHLKFEGYFNPSTILVTGRDIYLDTVKAAWAQRTIRSPKGFTVHRVGEVCSITMMPISQSQFTPLPEALCITISDLTKNNGDASFDAIMGQLKNRYKGLQQPTEQITYQTLASLIKERKIYHTGRGYHILSPDLYQPGSNNIMVKEHHLVIGGTDTANGMTPMLYIPLVQQANHTDVRSISCQTEAKSPDVECPAKTDKADGINTKKSDKSPSSKEEKKSKRDGFVRSSSLRYSDEKSKNLVKDINLKTSDINQDKDKGEKSSLFSKLFGRNKTKDSGSLKEEDKSDMVEHVTFSAQFPPQEWGWYEAQLNHQAHGQVSPDSFIHPLATWPDNSLCMPLDPHDESSIEAVYHEIHNHSADCPMAQSVGTLPANILPRSSSHSGSWSSLNDLPGKPVQRNQINNTSKSHHRQEKMDSRQKKTTAEIHHNSFDVRPKDDGKVNGLEPLREKVDIRQYKNTFDEPQILNNAMVMLPERPSHVTKVFRKYREMKCTVPCTNDISMEYCGRIPRKDSQLAKSRDSGVNCIGLVHSPQPQMFSSCHYNTDVAPLNNHIQAVQNGTDRYPCDPDVLVTSSLPSKCYEDAKNTSWRHNDDSFNSSKSPGQLSCDDRYPFQEIQNEAPEVGSGDFPYPPNHLHHHHHRPPQHHPHHHDSEVSIWSDNSRQTVREVRQAGGQLQEGAGHAALWRHPDSHKQGRDFVTVHQNGDKHPSDEDQSRYYHRHGHTRSKSPPKSTKDSEKLPRSKTANRHSAPNGKTLANHVYESRQKVTSRQLSGRKTTEFSRH